MKIYDCFMFMNELDILEIRLAELYNVVDHFVIVEYGLTHRGNPKPFVLPAHWSRFAPWADKIRYIQIHDHPFEAHEFTRYCAWKGLDITSAWSREHFQRSCIQRGLWDAQPNDWIMISDCDEIIRPYFVQQLRTVGHNAPVVFNMPMFYFKFNYLSLGDWWCLPVAMPRSQIIDPQDARVLLADPQMIHPNTVGLYHAGWHFSYLNDEDWIKYKMQNFAHAEHDNKDTLARVNVNNLISKRSSLYGGQWTPVKLTDYWPEYIVKNQSRFSSFIIPDADQEIMNILK